MADVKISALPAATTPLAGTEVLPIVQSGVTAKVAVSNLTAGRSVSATAVAITGSTSGTATIVTPAAAGTPTITLPIVTGTLATLAGTETLTNKSIVATQLTGTIAAARLPSGAVLQVVNATYATATSTASASLVDTGLSASITPSATSSKILVLVNLSGVFSNSPTVGQFTITDGSNNILFGFEGLAGYLNAAGSFGCASTSYLHSPSTISSFTYKARMANVAGTGISINGVTTGSTSSTITLMEIAA